MDATDAVDRISLEWARERPDLDTTPAAIIGRLGRLHVHLDARLERGFKRFGLTRSGWDVLAALRQVGRPYRLPQKALMPALMRASGTTSFRVDRLESRGLVRRIVALTAAGLRLADAVAPAHLANEADILRVLSPAEQAMMVPCCANFS
jgi:DNA-binding MarR family transcriptional regulator